MVPPALASLPALGVARHAWLEVLGKPNQRQNGGGLTGRHRATCFPARPALPAGAGQAGHMCPTTAKVPCPCAKLYPNKKCCRRPHLHLRPASCHPNLQQGNRNCTSDTRSAPHTPMPAFPSNLRWHLSSLLASHDASPRYSRPLNPATYGKN